MKKFYTIIAALLMSVSGAWAYSTVAVTSAQDSKGNALVGGAYYRILLPSRGASVALQQNGEYVKANDGLGIVGFMWKVEADANGKALISNPAGGYWKFTDYSEGNSKLKTNGTKNDCTAFQMAWYSSANKTLNLFDPNGGTYTYDNVTCGAVLSNHGGVGNNMGIYNNISDGGSIFKFERFYQTLFVVEATDVNGVAVESYPSTVTINGNITTPEYYTNSDNQITSFSTAYAAAYYIDGVEKTAEEVKNAINANTETLTVTVKPRPFIASTNEAPAYYALMISGNANSWLEGSGTDVNCGKDRALPGIAGRTNWMWQLVQDGTNGYRIYNVGTEKYIGGCTTTGGYLTLVDAASANSFIPVFNNATTIKFKDKTNSLWIDRAGGKTYAYTSGQQFTFKRMYKVTFSEAVAINGGDAVSTIYVAADGSDSFTLPSDKLYSINGADAVGYVDAQTAIAACSSNLTVTVSENTSKNVKYILKWSDGTTISSVENVATELLSPSADFLPSSMANSFVTFSYSPVTIAAETSEVTVTATWNGPFRISDSYDSAIWQIVQMHTYPGYPAQKWSWSYKSDDSDKVKPEQVLEYDGVTANRLFCFVGNPYQGFKIYNAAAGSGFTLNRSGDSDEISMASGEHIFTLHQSAVNTDASTYFCLKPSGSTYYVNYDYANRKIAGWTAADNGSTCWVVAPGQYYLDFIDGLNLDAPVGAVGTREYFQSVSDVATAKNNLRTYRTAVAGYMYSNELGSLNTFLNPIKNTNVIALANGYYRIVSAVPGFNQTAAWYYNPAVSADHITWAKAATNTEHQVNSIFKFTASDDKWNIFSPNAQNYLIHDNTAFSAQTGSIGSEAGDVEVSSIGSAQHTLRINVQTVHANGHNGGTGNAGTLINWNANDPGAASTWYLVKVEDVDLTLNGPVDGKYYATLCLPFDVTISDATAYTMTDNGTYLMATEVTDNEVPAGTPVLLKGDAATATATINTGEAFGQALDCALTGTYVDKAVSGADDYFLGSNGTAVGFYHWQGSTLKANRAYLPTGQNPTKGFALVFDDDDVTAIASAINGQMVNGQYFDLQGRKVQNPVKGQIYILNGKKVLF